MLSKMTNNEQEASEVTPKKGRFCSPLSMLGRFRPKGWSPGGSARAGMVGAVVGNEVGLPELVNTFNHALDLGGIGLGASLQALWLRRVASLWLPRRV